MKALTIKKYGKPHEVLKLDHNHPQPDATSLKPDEVLVKVLSSSLNGGDLNFVRGWPYLFRLGFGFFKPFYPVPGMDICGVVEAVGGGGQEGEGAEKKKESGDSSSDHDKSLLKQGDYIIGDTSTLNYGGWSEYVIVKSSSIAKLVDASVKPSTKLLKAAGCIPGAGATALQAVRDQGKLKAGETILIHGAGGGVGHLAVQIALASDASQVVAMTCQRKISMVKQLERRVSGSGRLTVVDYANKNALKTAVQALSSSSDSSSSSSSSPLFDVIIDCDATGSGKGLKEFQEILCPKGGRYIYAGGSVKRILTLGAFGSTMSSGNASTTSTSVDDNGASGSKKDTVVGSDTSSSTTTGEDVAGVATSPPRQVMKAFAAETTRKDLEDLAQMLIAGDIVPSISAETTLSELPRDADAKVSRGGKLLIRIDEALL